MRSAFFASVGRAVSRNIQTHSVEETADLKYYTDFKRLLKQKKITHKDGHTCLHVECRLCNRNTAQPATMAYVNKRTGTFICPSCDIKQNLSTAISVYDNTKPQINEKQINFTSMLLEKVSPIPQSVCDELGVINLSSNDLQDLNACYEKTKNMLSFPLKNVAGRVVGELLWNLSEKEEETFPTQYCSGLLIHGPANKQKAVVVTNLKDFLTLKMQRLENHCIVCLPYGLKALPQECLPGLEVFKELVFWFKFDSAGWDTAKALATKMDEKRCLLIRPTDTAPSPSIAHRKRYNLKQIIEKATPVRHKSITTFSALRNDVLSDLQNIEKVHGVKWKRFPILNKLLKGHRKGELTIITGPTGSGKTTFMSEYSLDLAMQGVSTLWGSFEIRNTRLAGTLLRQFVGYSLENKLNEFDYWASAFEKHPVYFMTFHGQQPLKIVMEAIEHAQYVHDINHVIIDNLQFMMGLSTQRTDKFWEQDGIIAAFRGFATKKNVHVTLVMHPRKERAEEDLTTSSVFGTAKATQEADNVLIIQDKRLTSLRGKRYLQIVKNRYSGDLGIMPLDFDKDSLSYAIKKKKEKEKDEKDKETIT